MTGDACTWEEAKKYCASTALAASLGGSGWRLPTKIELESIMDETLRDPAIDRDVFPDASAQVFPLFWTATPLLSNVTTEAWSVSFSNGLSKPMDASRFSLRVRCTRSTEADKMTTPPLRYDVSSDTVKDLPTGLTWQRKSDRGYTWEAAKSYCQNLAIAGGKWRLPALKELLTLVDAETSFPAIDPTAFADTQSDKFWTASPVAGTSVSWVVEFGRGLSDQQFPDSASDVRCVR